MSTPEQTTLGVKLEILHEDVTQIKDALTKLSDAIVKLALIEERQTVASAALERAFNALQKVEERVTDLELSNINSRRTSGWVDKLATAGIGILLILILKRAGIL